MKLFGFSVDAGVICVRCLMGMFAITLVTGRLASIGVADEKRFGFTEVVIIPWSTKDRTFLRAGPVNTFSSEIFLVDSNCEIFLDDKKINITDLKSPLVGELTFSNPRLQVVPVASRMSLRSIRFDPLTKDEHQASFPVPAMNHNNDRKMHEHDIAITDYNNMGQWPGTGFPRGLNWRFIGILGG